MFDYWYYHQPTPFYQPLLNWNNTQIILLMMSLVLVPASCMSQLHIPQNISKAGLTVQKHLEYIIS
jgi:hypothetical protein